MDDGMSEMGRGAEAIVYRSTYLGRDSVVKVRPEKGYRHHDLDRHLRMSRTKNEVRMLREARRAGIRTPVVYDVDLTDCVITMEYLEGEKVKDILERDRSSAESICKKIGRMLAMLHDAGICHGDLTTSNMIMNDSGELGVIDLSLGGPITDIEEMGVDLHLLERAFTSAHSEIEYAFDSAVLAYKENMKDADAVLKRVEDIKSRGRYT